MVNKLAAQHEKQKGDSNPNEGVQNVVGGQALSQVAFYVDVFVTRVIWTPTLIFEFVKMITTMVVIIILAFFRTSGRKRKRGTGGRGKRNLRIKMSGR